MIKRLGEHLPAPLSSAYYVILPALRQYLVHLDYYRYDYFRGYMDSAYIKAYKTIILFYFLFQYFTINPLLISYKKFPQPRGGL